MRLGGIQRIHFVGIGGIGMSGIAELLLNLGCQVSGSDKKRSAITRGLSRRGALIHRGHRREWVEGQHVHLVVVSSAVPNDNPEILAAHAGRIPVIGRGEMLAELMRLKYSVAVAGSHGKTTTTSMIAAVLHRGGLDPTVVVGGRIKSLRTNARLGKGDFLVAESDESDGSFLKMLPTWAVITNIDPEHMNFYGTMDHLTQAFVDFANRVPFYGAVVACLDHPGVRPILPHLQRRVVTYGQSQGAGYRISDLAHQGMSSSFGIDYDGAQRCEITLGVPGEHNILNATAAFAIGHELKIPVTKIKDALQHFKGVGRRLEVLLKRHDVTVVDDYGHHPAEVSASLKAVRAACQGRLVTVFQPHRYTRTRDLFADFTRCFDATDELILLDIYPASEPPIAGISSAGLAEALAQRRGGHITYLTGAQIERRVLASLKAGDILLTLGAGDIGLLAKRLVRELKKTTLEHP